MEESYRELYDNKASEKPYNDTLPKKALGMATTTLNETTKKETSRTVLTVSIEGLRIEKANWNKFQGLVMIDEEAKKQFLSDVLNDMIEHLLYRNPELFNFYVLQSRKRPSL